MNHATRGAAKLVPQFPPEIPPPFQILILSEESRLGHEQIETGYALKQIIDSGVRVFFYLEGKERTLDTAMDKMMLALTNFGAEIEREKARQRTHDAMLRKARFGHVVGGRTYGYDHLEMFGEPALDGQRLRQCVVRRINPLEAAVVRRIFEGYASGLGLTRLAKSLNCDHIPPPRRGRHGWAPSAIREIIHRDLYAGVVFWNRTQSVQRGGTKKQLDRPKSDWIRIEAPELRIVPDDLWNLVQERLRKSKEAYQRANDGRLLARVSGVQLRSQYLLSGIARCAVCGGSVSVFTRTKGRYVQKLYGCVYYHKRGTAVCTNSTQVGMEVLDSALLHSLREILDERILEEAVRRALQKIRSEEIQFPDRRMAFERELSLIETRLGHLVETIAAGNGSDSVFSALQAEEARKKALVRQLAELKSMGDVRSLNAAALARDLRARLTDLKALLTRHAPETRQLVRQLIDGKLICRPILENGRPGFKYVATGTYGGLVLTNDGGGGQALRPSLVPYLVSNLSFTIQGQALAR